MSAIIQTRMIPDPMISDSEFIHQRSNKPGPHVGKIAAQVNMVELIGGFARFRNRTEAQEKAAAHYRILFERAQIGGARALDYAAVKVDTSGPDWGATADIGAWARQGYAVARATLGHERSQLMDNIIVHDMSMRGLFPGARLRERMAHEVRDCLDVLAVEFGFQTRAAA